MKILWVNVNFLHPTNKGGLIRTLEMLRILRQRYEIHYAAIEDPSHPEATARASEYCHRAYPLRHYIADRNSVRFYIELAAGLFSPVPVAVKRFYSPGLRNTLDDLLHRERFDRAVVDHLAPASFFPDLPHSLLFQHNVETIIWQRHTEQASGLLRRPYFRLQAHRMFEFERRVCREAGQVVAVSHVDAAWMREHFGLSRVCDIPTGVDVPHYSPPGSQPHVADLVFVGSMDWLANIDAVAYFVDQVLPLVRQRRPECSLAIVGRNPPAAISRHASDDPRVIVTGTVDDVRPFLWGSCVSIVPLRIGGGTRIKIYESMAAKTPVVSTALGAEGLEVAPGENIRIADTPQQFAEHCIELLKDPEERKRIAEAGWEMVHSRFTWEKVSDRFSEILDQAPGPR